MDEETSDATIQSESPGPRAPADGGPILNRARACCIPDCRAADVAVVAFWLVCLACFLAGLWERTMLPMRSKSRADPIYYTGIVMIAVGTLVLLTYFVVRLERVRSAARTPFSPSDMHEWVALIPGVVTVKARREAPVVRRVSNFLLELGAFVLFVTPCVDIALASNLALANSAYIPYAVPTTFVVVVSCVTALLLLVRVFTRGSRAISTTGATYLDLHLFCVYIAGVALVIAIVLGLTLGPNKARKVSRRYDDEGAGDDERVFREGAYVRCGLLALILAVFGLGVRLRRVAGAPTTRRLASRSIELTSHAS